MDEQEFRRLLELFPTVRSPDYYLELDAPSQSTSQSKQKEVKQLQDGQSKGGVVESNTQATGHEAFWGKLRAAVEKKMSPAEAEEFCKTFRQVYKKLVDEELSLEAARSLLSS